MRCKFAPHFVNNKKAALDLQPYVIRFVNYLPKVSGSRRLPPPRYSWNTAESGAQSHSINQYFFAWSYNIPYLIKEGLYCRELICLPFRQNKNVYYRFLLQKRMIWINCYEPTVKWRGHYVSPMIRLTNSTPCTVNMKKWNKIKS